MVNIAGYAAENILSRDLKVINYDEFNDFVKENNAVVLDVRTPQEHGRGNIENSVNINVDELRERINELDKDQTYVIYCQVGLRGYLANRILRNNGFNNVVNLQGGYNLWSRVHAEKKLEIA